MKHEGFTLLELVVAMAVAGIALIAGYAALARVMDQRERAAEAIEQMVHAATVRQTVATWIRGARVTGQPDGPVFLGLDGMHHGKPNDELRFFTMAAPPQTAGAAQVRIYVDRDEATPIAGLVAQVGHGPSGSPIIFPIAPAAIGFEARYGFRSTGDWRWLPSWISSVRLPAAVKLRVVFRTDSVPSAMRLPILVPTVMK